MVPTTPYAEPEPYDWWGFGCQVSRPLSIVELLDAGNFDTRTAATLWLLIEARASIIVAAAPPAAGKTTTLSALADFLPPAIERRYLRGENETFDWRATADPARSYLLCNEISPHLPVYLWGIQVGRLFAAAEAGFGFGATMHADTAEEVLAILAGRPLAIAPRALARLDLVLTLAVDYRDRRPRRRLDTLTLLRRDGSSGSIVPLILARWDLASDALVHSADPCPPLISRVGLTPDIFATERDRRAAFVIALRERGIRARADVRRALAVYPDLPATAGA